MIRGHPERPRSGPVPPAAYPREARRRLKWGWRLFVYVVLLLSLTLVLNATVVLAGLADDGTLSPGTVVATAAAVLAASWVMMSKVESRSPAALGLLPGRRASRDVLLGAGIGMCLVGVVCLAMLGAGWIESPAFAPNPTRWILRAMEVTGVVLVAAFTEELAVRGYPFQVLAENLGPVGATVLTATLFALLHGWNPGVGWIALGNTFLAGILLGIMYWRTLSLWLVTGAHFAWNWTMGVAVGLPVSGVHFDLPGPRVRALGPASLTGGAYGPEGGWLLGLVTLAGIVWMARTPLLSRDPEVVALGPLPCGPGPTFGPVRLSDQEPTEESTEDR